MRKLGIRTKLAFGVGQTAEGLKNGAFDSILFFYYNQVLGLSGSLVGTAFLIAIIVDGFTDPLVASISDNHDSRWGRRHPFMYGAAIPMAFFFVMVFLPPSEISDLQLFAWLTVMTVAVRVSMTFYLIPHLALGAELSSDYHERTSIVAYRTFFTIVAGAAVLPISFFLFFQPTPLFANGQMNPTAYQPFALVFAVLMVLAILITAIGTHHRIPLLSKVSADREPISIKRVLRELWQSASHDAFKWFFLGVLMFSAVRGTQGALNVHMFTFFWELTPDQIGVWGIGAVVGSAAGVVVWSQLSKWLGKKETFITGLLLWGVLFCLPPLAKVLGFFPDQSSAVYFPLIVGLGTFGMFSMTAQVTGGSMIADVADEQELLTGQRQEGMFFGAVSFSSKASSGLGHLIAGFALDLIAFPTHATASLLPQHVIDQLGLVYGPAVFIFVLAAAWFVSRYGLTRTRVDEVQASLAERRSTA